MPSQTWPFDADTYMDNGNPTAVKGAEESIIAQWTVGKDWDIYRPIFEVDFSGTIPAGSTINTAVITQNYHTGIVAEDARYTYWRLRRADWDEAFACWTNYKENTAWEEPGAVDEDLDIDLTIISEEFQHPHYIYHVHVGHLWFDVDVKAAVENAILSHSSILRMVCFATAGEVDNYWAASSREDGAEYHAPFLDIDWTPPVPPEGYPHSQGYVFSKLRGLHLPSLPRGWLRRPDLRGLALPAAV